MAEISVNEDKFDTWLTQTSSEVQTVKSTKRATSISERLFKPS